MPKTEIILSQFMPPEPEEAKNFREVSLPNLRKAHQAYAAFVNDGSELRSGLPGSLLFD